MPCPLGCNTCALSGTTSSGEPLLKCFTCLSTYTLSAGTCVNPCPAPCAKCIMTNNKYPACTLCTAPAYNDC